MQSLVPGIYRVEIEKQGFDRERIDKVEVLAGQIVTVNSSLKVGSVSSTVEVTAQAAMLNSGSSDVATTIEKSIITNIPLTERNSLEAAMLVPGVRGDPNSPGQVVSENAGIYTGNISPGAATNVSGGMPGGYFTHG